MNKLKIGLLSLIMILLTGCVKVETNFKVNSNNSGDLTLVYALDKQLANTETKNQIETMKNEARDQGYKVSGYSSEKYFGVKIKKHYGNLKNIKAPSGNTDLFEIDIKEDKRFFKTKYDVKSVFDFEDIIETEEDEIITKELEDSILSQLDLTFNLELPVKAGKNNATEIKDNGKNLYWSFIPGIKNYVEVEFTKTNYLNITLVFAGVLLIVGFLLFIRKKRKLT